MRVIVGIVGFALGVVAAFASSAAEPTMTVEFRRAEWEPAPGLTAAQASKGDRTVYMHDKAELTNADIASATVAQSEDGKHAVVDFTMTDEGGRKLAALTRSHLMKPLAILIDGKLLMTPRIVSEISHQVQISGNFDQVDAERIAASFLGKPTP
jgi:preprotein translocase subunit SecD